MTPDDRTSSARTESAGGEPKPDSETLPTFSEQLSEQLGGVRGVLESGIPVAVFVIVNIFGALNLAIIIGVASALALAIYRLARKESIRNAINGLLGIGIGAFIAWKTGSARDFYLPGIIMSGVYGLAMLASVPLRRPLIGWVWSLLAAGGSTRWREQPRMVRLFNRLTIIWALTYLAKVGLQAALFQATSADDPATALGVARLVLGYPPYALLLAYTAWSVRRLTAAHPELAAR
jgi:hypothetical protein